MRRASAMLVALVLALALAACGRLGPPVRSHRGAEPAAAAEPADPGAQDQQDQREEEVEEPLL